MIELQLNPQYRGHAEVGKVWQILDDTKVQGPTIATFRSRLSKVATDTEKEFFIFNGKAFAIRNKKLELIKPGMSDTIEIATVQGYQSPLDQMNVRQLPTWNPLEICVFEGAKFYNGSGVDYHGYEPSLRMGDAMGVRVLGYVIKEARDSPDMLRICFARKDNEQVREIGMASVYFNEQTIHSWKLQK